MADANTLLLAWDGSAPAERAFEFAIEQARTRNLALHVVNVIELPEVYGGIGPSEIDQGELDRQRAALAGVCARAQAAGVSCTSELRVGVAIDLIIAALKGSKAIGLVMGRSDKGRVMRWLVGSVSRGLIEQVAVPVTLVP